MTIPYNHYLLYIFMMFYVTYFNLNYVMRNLELLDYLERVLHQITDFTFYGNFTTFYNILF
jgi:hypothetical protein